MKIVSRTNDYMLLMTAPYFLWPRNLYDWVLTNEKIKLTFHETYAIK
jgi:hypothetical protein